MNDYEPTARVDASADALFAYLSDVDNLPDYFERMTEAEPGNGQEVTPRRALTSMAKVSRRSKAKRRRCGTVHASTIVLLTWPLTLGMPSVGPPYSRSTARADSPASRGAERLREGVVLAVSGAFRTRVVKLASSSTEVPEPAVSPPGDGSTDMMSAPAPTIPDTGVRSDARRRGRAPSRTLVRCGCG